MTHDGAPDTGASDLYKPIVDLGRREVVGVEARTPSASPPGLPRLPAACARAAHWARQGLRLEIAVALTGEELADPQLVPSVSDALLESGLEASLLLLEISERSLTDERQAVAALDALAALGVKLVVRDFGTGHSSLLHLRRHRIEALKVSAPPAARAGHDADGEAMVGSIAHLAASLGSRLVVQGVSSVEQHARLVALRCQAMGPLYARPVPASELPAAVDVAEAALEHVAVPRPRSADGRAFTRGALPDPEVLDHMQRLLRDGASTQTIAAALNRMDAPHPQGLRWHQAAVGRYLAEAAAARRRAMSR